VTQAVHAARQELVGERERTAVLVIRAWLDEERTQIRARIIGSTDAPGRNVTETTALGSEEVLAAVAHWLRSLTTQRR